MVMIQSTEIVTLAKHNYEKYQDSVERMKYYQALGVEFRDCGLAAKVYSYQPGDLYDFVTLEVQRHSPRIDLPSGLI